MQEKLHICLTNDSFPPCIDGVANVVTNYAAIIQRSHGAAAVATPYYPNADDSAYDFPVVRYPSLNTERLVGYRAGIPFSAPALAQLEGMGFDLIHSHCPVVSTMLARVLRDRLQVPLVFTYHTKFDIDIANAIRGKLLQEEAIRLLVQNVDACDEVWVVSSGAGDNLRGLGYQGDCVVMPNGVDFPKGRVSEAAIAAAAAQYDLPAGVPVFLFVGRMMWYKGLRIILDALHTLDMQGADFRMVLIGGGTDYDEVRAYATQLGLDGKCLFTGAIYDRDCIRAWYCRADLFLFPSTFDTNGLVVREAAACALASVLIGGSCAAEDITDGETGFLIEENAGAMAAKLSALLENREAMRVVGETAQREIYLSWEASVAHAYDRYQIVMDNFRRGAYPAHRAISDDFFRAVGQTLGSINRTRARQQALRQDLTEERMALITGLDSRRGHLQETLENLWQSLDRFL